MCNSLADINDFTHELQHGLKDLIKLSIVAKH